MANYSLKNNKGFTLLVAIVVTGMLLLISYVVTNVATRQLIIANSNKESQYAFYNADSGTECAIFWDFNGGVSAFSNPSVSSTISCGGNSITTTGNGTATTTFTVNLTKGCVVVKVGKQSYGTTIIDSRGYNDCNTSGIRRLERGVTLSYPSPSSVSGSTDFIWLEDSNSPAFVSSSQDPGSDGWNWVSSPVNSGTESNASAIIAGVHQHYFYSSANPMAVNTGDTLFAYVYLDPANPPSQVELQWNDGSWEHRAFWNNTGTDQVGWGSLGTNSLRYMGALPSTGVWVRLSIPASVVGLEGSSVNGLAFTLYDGRAYWDNAGKSN